MPSPSSPYRDRVGFDHCQFKHSKSSFSLGRVTRVEINDIGRGAALQMSATTSFLPGPNRDCHRARFASQSGNKPEESPLRKHCNECSVHKGHPVCRSNTFNQGALLKRSGEGLLLPVPPLLISLSPPSYFYPPYFTSAGTQGKPVHRCSPRRLARLG